MDNWRNRFDKFYNLIKPAIFSATARDPEQAHHLFTTFCQVLYYLDIDEKVLDNTSNQQTPPWKISNAAGFNKNAELPPRVMKYLGFDRAVIGTLTADEWKGNPRPRTKRFPKTQSLINWMGLPGIGAQRVAEQLWDYKGGGLPVTINLMSTPGKEGKAMLKDLEETVLRTRFTPNADRFELNISCPNTHSSTGEIDTREEYKSQLKAMLHTVKRDLLCTQHLYLKVSPDLDEKGVDEIIRICDKYDVTGFTTTNTTTNHNPRYIPNSPGQGGASGDAVYEASLRVQKLFAERTDKKLIACGGIDSVERARERCAIGNTNEIQLYTPIIFRGPGLLRKLREAK